MKTLSNAPLPDCSPFRDQAAALIAVGLSPIPFIPGEKKPVGEEWHLFADRLPPETVITWWETLYPDAGVGMPLGQSLDYSKDSYLVAINIDQDHYVESVKALLFGDDTTEKPVYVAKRGSMGGTIFAISNERLETRRFSDDIGLAIELLSKGAQIVLPPSIHPDGIPYKWISDETLLTAFCVGA